MKDPRASKGPARPAPPATDRETSDLFDLKAIAASTRAGATPPPTLTAAELSGAVLRRDSVVGMRVSARGAAVPPWFFGVIGCLGVMAVGLGIFWYLSSSPGGRPAVASTTLRTAAQPLTALTPPQGPQIVPLPSHAEPAPVVETLRPEKPVRRFKAAHAEAAPAAEPVEEPAPQPAPSKPNVLDAVLGEALNGEQPAAKKTGSAVAAAPAGETDSPARTVDAALEDLQPKVRQCFHRFQIRGVAAVNLTVAPSGAIQSPALTGDFEGTPTGDCVIKELASAALPPFRGGPLKVSHQYIFR